MNTNYITKDNKERLVEFAERLLTASSKDPSSVIINEMLEYAEETFAVKPKTFVQRFSYWIKGLLSGFLIYSVHYLGIAFMLFLTLKLWFPLPYIMCFGIFATLRLLYVNVTKMSNKKNHKLLKRWTSKK